MIQADDMRVESHLTHIDNPEDLPYLRGKLPDVNMRLFYRNAAYRNLVWAACNHLATLCVTKLEGYKLPHGISGANVGVPWNIIAVARNRGARGARGEIMINPHILAYMGDLVVTESNCGSIRLPAPIKVRRRESVNLSYYEFDGTPRNATFDRSHGSFTIQHEVDHNMGVLITDWMRRDTISV